MRIERLKLKRLLNTRDLGGFPTADGRTIKKGRLIRSGKLSRLPKETATALKELGVNLVIDLRIETERNEAPDTMIEGAEYVKLPLLCTATAGITHDKSMRSTMAKESRRIEKEFGTAENYMIEMYRTILFGEQPREVLARVLRLIIENEGCVLWHCSGGKDRAGMVSMLVEGLLGVSEENIIADYVASHEFQKGSYFWSRFGLRVVPLPRHFRDILWNMMAAKTLFITTILSDIKERYGSVAEYCKQWLGITDEDIERMKDKYLE